MMLMRLIFVLVFGMFSSAVSSQQTSAPVTTSDPLSEVQRFMGTLESKGADDFATEIGISIGNAQAKDTFGGQLRPFEKTKPKFSAVAFDREYGGAIRHIVVYQHGLSQFHPFLYFRFVFKQTGSGWQLTLFGFHSEGQLPFPSGYGIF